MAENEKEIISDPNAQTEQDAPEVTFVSLSDVKAEKSEPKEVKTSVVLLHSDYDEDYPATDVSEPQTPRKESEIRREEAENRRREWIKSHLTYIFIGVGVVVVALTVVIIMMYYRSVNPVSRFISAASKDFGTSFDFDVELKEGEKAVMHYQGAISSDRSDHLLTSVYQADYGSYTYTGAVGSVGRKQMRGSLYKDKWTAYDCTERVQDFYDFDRNISSGKFNGGAFLRFTGLTSNYESAEFEAFVSVLMDRLTTDSPIATVTTSKTAEGTRYDYKIDLNELFNMVKTDGASIFYRSTDYDKFCETYEMNKQNLEASSCTFSYFIDTSGYLTELDAAISTGGVDYALSCRLSNFGSAEVNVPEDFLAVATLES